MPRSSDAPPRRARSGRPTGATRQRPSARGSERGACGGRRRSSQPQHPERSGRLVEHPPLEGWYHRPSTARKRLRPRATASGALRRVSPLPTSRQRTSPLSTSWSLPSGRSPDAGRTPMRHTAGKPLQSLAKVLGIPLAPPGSDGAGGCRRNRRVRGPCSWRELPGPRSAARRHPPAPAWEAGRKCRSLTAGRCTSWPRPGATCTVRHAVSLVLVAQAASETPLYDGWEPRWYRHCTETEWRQENGRRMAERGKNAQT